MSSPPACPEPLQAFVRPMLGQPAWNVKQGHGSFLTFEFGEPKLEIKERHSPEGDIHRSAYVHGEWHLWIYCCHWRVLQHGTQLATSEDGNDIIGRATATLNGQKLIDASVTDQAQSKFTFDLGGSLETRPYGDDPIDEQWIVLRNTEAFGFRADGTYSHGPSDTPADSRRWTALR